MIAEARLAAAIEVLDRVLAGESAEAALTGWARGNRYAGSGDRSAVRDLVFDALRCRRSFAALGGGLTGRGLILGAVRDAKDDEEALFSGIGHAPARPGPADFGRSPEPLESLDCPDWLAQPLQAALDQDFGAVMQVLRQRAPVFVRVNVRKATIEATVSALAGAGIIGVPHPLAPCALEIIANPRKIRASQPYSDGWVELQDASSQAVVEILPLKAKDRVLDYCAGGGGKTLAMAAREDVAIWAHDAVSRRMVDLPGRSARAGVNVTITQNPDETAPYDLVLTDVPCSGSGSWRRDPQGKWALTPLRLAALVDVQADILDRAAVLVAPEGTLAYVTCSMLCAENEEQIAAFQSRHPEWHCRRSHRFTPLEGGDGFFVGLLTRAKAEITQPERE